MKRIMARAVTLAAMVSLCLLLWFSIKPPVEAQAASAVTVNNYNDLVKYCGNKTIDYTITIGSNFKVTGVVFVYGNKTIKGNGKTLTCDTAVEIFHVKDGAGLTVENLTVDRTSCPTNHIFYVERRGNLVINSGTYKAGPADTLKGVSVVKAYGRCTINGGDFSGSSGRFYGIGLHGPYSYTINGGNFHDCTTSVGLLQYQKGDETSDALWELEGFTQTLTINGGNFHDNQNNGVTIGNTDVDQPGASTVIVNNGNFYNNGLNGISVVDDAAELKIKRINSYGNNVGLYVAKGKITGISTASDATYLNIYNNKTYNVYVTDGGTFSAGHGNIYSDGAQTQIGVYVRKSSFATIKAGLNIKGHTTDSGYGVYVNKSTFAMSGGMISGNTYGVYMDYGYDVTVSGGTVKANTKDGIRMIDCEEPSISGVSVTDNGGSGIYFSWCTDAAINGGTISGNKYGISNYNSTLNIKKVSAVNNTSAGIYAGSGTIAINASTASDVKICGNTSYGVYLGKTAKFSANNATICGGNGYNAQTTGICMWSSDTATVGSGVDIYGNSYGIDTKTGTTITSADIYSNTTGIYMCGGTVNLTGGTIKDGTNGVWVKEAGTVNMTGGTVSENSVGINQGCGKVIMSGGTVTQNTSKGVSVTYSKGVPEFVFTGGKIISNKAQGIYVYGSTGDAKVTMSGGEISGNASYGVDAKDKGIVNISGGNITGNSGSLGEVYDGVTNFTLTGTYSGRSSVNGYVYLAKNDNYVKTASSSTLIKVRPSTYYSGRVVINTSSTSYASTQERSTLYPNSNWILKKSGVNVVLARIPSIYYNDTEVTGTLTLGWYNADTISGMGKFTAKDPDSDLSSFVMKYEGQTVATGTKDSAGVMHLNYDFKIEGIREYTLTATDSLGNSVTRTVIVMVDLTPPSIIDVPDSNPDDEPDDGSDDEGSAPDDGSGDEPDDENGGEGSTYTWTVVIVEPDATIEQQGEDMLSGVANISVSKFSEQDVFIKKIYDAPYRIKVSLADYPDERGVVIKVVDKAGNAAYKCVLDKSKLEIKIEPFYPTK